MQANKHSGKHTRESGLALCVQHVRVTYTLHKQCNLQKELIEDTTAIQGKGLQGVSKVRMDMHI